MTRLPEPGERYWPSILACANDPSVPVGRTTLHDWINRGHLKVLKVGKRNVITADALHQALARMAPERESPEERRLRYMRRRNWRMYRERAADKV